MKKLMNDILTALLIPLLATNIVNGGMVTQEITAVTQATVQTHLENLMFQTRSMNSSSEWELTATYAAANFVSGTDPAVSLTTAGTYKISRQICATATRALLITHRLHRPSNSNFVGQITRLPI